MEKQSALKLGRVFHEVDPKRTFAKNRTKLMEMASRATVDSSKSSQTCWRQKEGQVMPIEKHLDVPKKRNELYILRNNPAISMKRTAHMGHHLLRPSRMRAYGPASEFVQH